MEDTSGELPCFAEAELMEAAYGHCFQLCDPTGYDGVMFSVNLELLETILKISLPAKYPEEPLRFSLDGKFTHSEGKSLRLDLNQFVGETGQVGSLELCQQATELLRELSDKKQKMSNSTVARPVYMRKEVIIARFSIYFHHIWSPTKRAFIFDCARYLSLGGFSKIGYPGIVVIEGDKLDVLDFVNRVQKLRWKHMVVRGEQMQPLFPIAETHSDGDLLNELAASQLIDNNRKFPSHFMGELCDTSEAGSICEQVGAHDIFLSAMKIFVDSTNGGSDS